MIIIETVGVGQVEMDVLDIADTIVLVGVPGLGDSIQAFKAGIMEIADLYVINQADRPGADKNVHDIETMIKESKHDGWTPSVFKTIAIENKGIKELVDGIERHKNHLQTHGLWREKREERKLKQLWKLIQEELHSKVKLALTENLEIGI